MEVLLLRQPLLSHIMPKLSILRVRANPGACPTENDLKLSTLKVTALVAASWMASSAAIATPEITPSSFERATRELTGYCLEGVCLGMSIPEVSTLGKLEWNAVLPADGKLSCHSTLGNSVTGYLLAKGKGFVLSFDLVTTAGNPVDRYRVNGITLIQPAPTEALTSAHIESFKSRLGPMKEVMAKGLWTANQRPFAITVGKAPSDGKLPERLLLLATYRPRAEWVMSLPECRTKTTH